MKTLTPEHGYYILHLSQAPAGARTRRRGTHVLTFNIEEYHRIPLPDWMERYEDKNGKLTKVAGGMAFNRCAWDRHSALMRRVPKNEIWQCSLKRTPLGYKTSDWRRKLQPLGHPVTHDGRVVTGCEDPTTYYVNSSSERWCLYSRSTQQLGEGSLVSLCAVDINNRFDHPRELITPEDLRQASLGDACDMGKEAEPFEDVLFFEYADGDRSHIGVANLHSAPLEVDKRSIRPFLTCWQDESYHVSTGGRPFELSDGRTIMIYNRNRVVDSVHEWAPTFGVLSLDDRSFSYRHSEWIIRAEDLGISRAYRGPGEQLIAFASGVTPLGNDYVEILLHVNDDTPFAAIGQFKAA